MGRGGNKQTVGSAAVAGLRNNIVKHNTGGIKKYIEAEYIGEGDVIQFQVGITDEGDPRLQELVLGPKDPALTLHGMKDIESAEYLIGKKVWQVSFSDGETMLVDLETMSVAGADDDTDENRLRGALAFALAKEMSIDGGKTNAEKQLALQQKELNRGFDTTSYQRRAIAALAVLNERGKDVRFDDSRLQEMLAEMNVEPETDFDPNAPVPDENSLPTRINNIIAGAFENAKGGSGINPAHALIGRVDENGEEDERFKEDDAMFWEAALALSNGDKEKAAALIPEEQISFEDELKKDADGNPIFAKDENGKKIPAYDENGERKKDENGNPAFEYEVVKDANGNASMVSTGAFYVGSDEARRFSIINKAVEANERLFIAMGRPGAGKNATEKEYAAMRKMPYHEFIFSGSSDIQTLLGGDALAAREVRDSETGEIKGMAAVSVVSEGPIARAFAQPGCSSLQEIIEIKGETTILNGLGSYIGETGDRYITISSSQGEFSYKVHPEHYVFASFNPGQGEERMLPSFHERGTNLVYDLPDTEEMAKRYATQVSKLMKSQDYAPELARDYTAKEVMPFVQLMEKMNDAYDNGEAGMVMAPGPRVMTKLAPQLLFAAYENDDDPLGNMRECLHYCLETETMDHDARDNFLSTLSSDIETSFKELAESATAANPDNADILKAKSEAKKKAAAAAKKKNSK